MKKQNPYAGRIQLPAPPAHRLANLLSRYRSFSIVIVICLCIAGLSAYAGLIVSFLGGIHWGVAMRSATPPLPLLAWGVTPSLLAWVAVMMPANAGLVLHGLLLLVCYGVDRRLYPRHGLGAWLTLRFRLSGVAALSCFLGAAGT